MKDTASTTIYPFAFVRADPRRLEVEGIKEVQSTGYYDGSLSLMFSLAMSPTIPAQV